MTKHLLFIALFLGSLLVQAQELPQPSPAASVSQRFGLTDVEITYSRPGVKDRRIFGDLVPLDKLWRTGANKNTTIEFSTTVFIADQKIGAGKYSLFTIPGKEEWTVIINSKNDHSGTGGYNDSLDVVRFKVPAMKVAEKVESFMISLSNVKTKTVMVDIAWDMTKVSFEVMADPTGQAVENIKAAVKSEDADFRTFHGSAQFLLDNEIDNEQALSWAQKSVEMEKRFWNLHLLAKAYQANGMKQEAMKTATESLKMSTAAEYEPYVKKNRELLRALEGSK